MVAAAKFARALVYAVAVAAALCTPATTGAAAAPEKAAGPAPMVPAAADAVDCSSVIYSMTDCLDYVTPFSNVSVPPATCCEGIKEVVKVSPRCLCDALGESASMGVQVNMSRADELPVACKISVPDSGKCSGSVHSSPVAAPAGAAPSEVEAASSPSSVSSAPVSADGPASASASAQPPRTATSRAPAPAPSASAAGVSLPMPSLVLVISLAAATCFYF